MHGFLDTVLFWSIAAIVVLVAIVSASEWSRNRQYRENLKPNSQRRR